MQAGAKESGEKASPSAGAPATDPPCAACGKSPARSRCGRCRAVRYCGPACQRAHWKEHKAQCKKTTKKKRKEKTAAAATAEELPDVFMIGCPAAWQHAGLYKVFAQQKAFCDRDLLADIHRPKFAALAAMDRAYKATEETERLLTTQLARLLSGDGAGGDWRRLPDAAATGYGPSPPARNAQRRYRISAAWFDSLDTKAWMAFFAPFQALRLRGARDLVPEGAPAYAFTGQKSVNGETRRLTDALSQPLTAFFALRTVHGDETLASWAAEKKTVTIVMAGATNGVYVTEYGGLGTGTEAIAGDQKWGILPLLMPGASFAIVYVGPEAAPHARRSYPGYTVSAYKSLYHVPGGDMAANASTPLPDELTRRPQLMLCQNAGLQHGSDFEAWLPTLKDVAKVSLPFAVTMFDGGEFERSLLYCDYFPVEGVHPVDEVRIMFRKALYQGVNPFRSLFYLESQGDIYSINHHVLISGQGEARDLAATTHGGDEDDAGSEDSFATARDGASDGGDDDERSDGVDADAK